MKIGLLVPVLHPLEISFETINLARQINADSLWAPDHILGLSHPDHWESQSQTVLEEERSMSHIRH